MRKIELEIVAMSHSVTQSYNYAVVLGEKYGKRRLPVVIGTFEAQAIAVALERMVPNRPLTHDLFKNTLEALNVSMEEVIINNLLDGVFYARLVCFKDGERFEIDARSSDAIALAVRYQCPIYTYDFILDAAGVVLEDSGNGGSSHSSKSRVSGRDSSDTDSLEQFSLDALQRKLQVVLEREDYETAAKIRDEIKRREEKN